MSTWEEIAVPDALLDTSVGKQHQVLAQDIAPSGAYPVIDQGQSFIAGYCDDPSRVIDFALPVIIFGDHTRAFKYVDFPFVLGADGTKVLKPDPEQFDARYFYFAMLALDIPNRGYNRHFKILRERSIPKPPLPEQQRIAQVLSTVQEAIAQQERLIRTTTELKQALMQKLFTEGLRGEALKETEIGRVPESWEVVELGDVFKFTSGKPKPKDTTLTRSGERPIPVYGGNGIMGYTAELLLDHTTLILGRVGEYCGCAHLTEPKAWITDNALYVKEDKLKPNYEYLREHLDHLDLNQYSNKMGQPLITQGIIGKVKFGLPTRKEQDEIATALKAVENRIHVAELKRNALRDLFRTLLHELMTGKVRVNID
ncbi:MAG: restriction endonuclease subunit S [Flavobacteriales bacterium]|nr:restriction endonuclease subunit S [Flavobacteriales bacterium]